MKYKAKYGAESDIPSEVKAFYVMKDGEWVFNGSDFEGLDALLNPGLATNRDAIKSEKDTQKTRADAAEKERDEYKAKYEKSQKPGTVVMDAKEQQLLTEYKALGPVADVKKSIENEKAATDKLNLLSTKDEILALAKDAGLNAEALVDFKLNSERGKDVVLAIEKKKVKDDKGKETEKPTLVVKITDNINGQEKVSTKDFQEYAKENHYPDYLVGAIYAGAQPAADDKGKKPSSFIAPPSLGSRASTVETGDKSVDVANVVAKYNQQRSTRQLPWSKPQEKQTSDKE